MERNIARRFVAAAAAAAAATTLPSGFGPRSNRCFYPTVSVTTTTCNCRLLRTRRRPAVITDIPWRRKKPATLLPFRQWSRSTMCECVCAETATRSHNRLLCKRPVVQPCRIIPRASWHGDSWLAFRRRRSRRRRMYVDQGLLFVCLARARFWPTTTTTTKGEAPVIQLMA